MKGKEKEEEQIKLNPIGQHTASRTPPLSSTANNQRQQKELSVGLITTYLSLDVLTSSELDGAHDCLKDKGKLK